MKISHTQKDTAANAVSHLNCTNFTYIYTYICIYIYTYDPSKYHELKESWKHRTHRSDIAGGEDALTRRSLFAKKPLIIGLVCGKWPQGHSGWQRCIGCLESQVSFCKRATNHRALLQKMTFKDKASYGSSPPCIFEVHELNIYMYIYIHVCTHTRVYKRTCNPQRDI